MEQNAPLRLLCLHGFSSNNDISAMQVLCLLLERKHGCSVTYLCGPVRAAGPQHPNLSLFSDGPWFKWDNSIESIRYVVDFALKNGPFDGVFGFSQGAAMLTVASSPSVWRDMYRLSACPWKFAICANTGSLDLVRQCRIEEKELQYPTNIPSLHILGQKDPFLKDGETFRKAFYSEQQAVLYHPHSHELPLALQANATFQAGLQAFFAPLYSARDPKKKVTSREKDGQ